MNITEFRKQYPAYDDLSDSALADAFYSKYYTDLDRADFDSAFLSAPQDVQVPAVSETSGVPGVGAAPQAPQRRFTQEEIDAQGGEFSRAFGSGIDSLQAMAIGGAEVVGELTGFYDTAGLAAARKEQERQAAEYAPPKVSSYTGVESGEDLFDYIASTVGGALPATAAILGTATGIVVGAPVLGVSAGVASGLAGATALLGGSLIGAGDVYSTLLDEGVDKESAADIAGIAGPAMGALELVPFASITKNLAMAPLKEEIKKGVLRRLAGAALRTGTAESVTEAGQEGISITAEAIGTGKTPDFQETKERLINSAIGGFLIGGPMGVGSGYVGGKRSAAADPAAADPAAAAAADPAADPAAVVDPAEEVAEAILASPDIDVRNSITEDGKSLFSVRLDELKAEGRTKIVSAFEQLATVDADGNYLIADQEARLHFLALDVISRLNSGPLANDIDPEFEYVTDPDATFNSGQPILKTREGKPIAGRYVSETGRVYIDPNQRPVSTLVHEITHHWDSVYSRLDPEAHKLWAAAFKPSSSFKGGLSQEVIDIIGEETVNEFDASLGGVEMTQREIVAYAMQAYTEAQQNGKTPPQRGVLARTFKEFSNYIARVIGKYKGTPSMSQADAFRYVSTGKMTKDLNDILAGHTKKKGVAAGVVPSKETETATKAVEAIAAKAAVVVDPAATPGPAVVVDPAATPGPAAVVEVFTYPSGPGFPGVPGSTATGGPALRPFRPGNKTINIATHYDHVAYALREGSSVSAKRKEVLRNQLIEQDLDPKVVAEHGTKVVGPAVEAASSAAGPAKASISIPDQIIPSTAVDEVTAAAANQAEYEAREKEKASFVDEPIATDITAKSFSRRDAYKIPDEDIAVHLADVNGTKVAIMSASGMPSSQKEWWVLENKDRSPALIKAGYDFDLLPQSLQRRSVGHEDVNNPGISPLPLGYNMSEAASFISEGLSAPTTSYQDFLSEGRSSTTTTETTDAEGMTTTTVKETGTDTDYSELTENDKSVLGVNEYSEILSPTLNPSEERLGSRITPSLSGQLEKYKVSKFDANGNTVLIEGEYVPDVDLSELEGAATNAASKVSNADGDKTKNVFGLFNRKGLFDKNKWLAAIADPYNNLLKQGAEAAYMHARLAHNTSGTIGELIVGGVAKWTDNGFVEVTDADGKPIKREGIPDIISDIASRYGNKGLHLWGAYVQAVRSRRLLEEGREKNLTASEINELLLLGKKYPEFEIARKKWIKYNDGILDIAVDSGYLSRKEAETWKEYGDYIPFYRVDDKTTTNVGEKLATRIAAGGVGRVGAPSRRLFGSERDVSSIVPNMILNTEFLITKSMRNFAMRKAVEELGPQTGLNLMKEAPKSKASIKKASPKAMRDAVEEHLGADHPMLNDLTAVEGMYSVITFEPRERDIKSTTVHVRDKDENGEAVLKYYDISDPLLFDALTFVPSHKLGAFMKILNWQRGAFSQMITKFPDFLAANFIRDTMSARAQYPGQHSQLMSALKGVVTSFKSDGVMRELRLNGGTAIGGYHTDNQLRRYQKMTGDQSENHIVVTAKNTWALWERVGEAFENANRVAVYNAAKNQGKSGFEAGFNSRDVLDFSLSGESQLVKYFITTVPFLNARIQGLYKYGRSGSKTFGGKGASRANFYQWTGLYALMATALYALNSEDDRYQALSDTARDMYIHIYLDNLPGVSAEDLERLGLPAKLTIPKPFEVGLIGMTLPERIMQQFMEDDATAVDFGKSVLAGVTGVLKVNPMEGLGPIVKGIAEDTADFNVFRMRSIVPKYQQQYRRNILEKAFGAELDQEGLAIQDPYASKLMNALGKSTNFAPQRIKNALDSWFPKVGALVMGVGDMYYRASQGLPPVPRRLAETPFGKATFGRFVGPEYPSYSQQQRELRELSVRLSGLNAAIKNAEKNFGIEDANRLRFEYANDLAFDGLVKLGIKELSKIATVRKQNDMIPGSEEEKLKERNYLDKTSMLVSKNILKEYRDNTNKAAK